MSLWTPDGERPVRRTAPGATSDDTAAAGPTVEELVELVALANGVPLDALPEDRRRELEAHVRGLDEADRTRLAVEMAQLAEMQQVRAELVEIPGEVHVVRFIQQFVESFLDLTAGYLQTDPPKFADAATVISAIDTVLDAFDTQLGEQRANVDQAVAQLKSAFVQLKQQASGGESEDPATDD